MKTIAVVLSGCGVSDGSEIYETVCTLLSIEKAGAKYQCMAPNIPQRKVTNHLTKQESSETRNVLVESARLARGEIIDIAHANPTDYDAVIFPGGFGAANNLSDFGTASDKSHIDSHILPFAKKMAELKKPAGFICIAPNLISHIYGKGVKMTIGTDRTTAHALEKMGNLHTECDCANIVVDDKHKVVTTPAFMLGKSITEISVGIDKLVQEVIRRT
ncbi:MAG TPA: isoprenoid biosynthesis glyoxalase ElbB [Gammaproteobacteria bacterium]|nr:isoprenoid biosynthesis glyoxalase ElbB [Gammaproteobacteria bacterium]